jgi:hypothetical protein
MTGSARAATRNQKGRDRKQILPQVSKGEGSSARFLTSKDLKINIY